MENLTMQEIFGGNATFGEYVMLVNALSSILLMPAVAILAIFIRLGQKRLSRMSLKESMFDRRLSILSAILDAHYTAGFDDIGGEDYHKLLARTGLAEFLGFKKSTMKYIKDVIENFKEAKLLQEHGDRRTLEQDKRYDELQRWFQAQVVAAKFVFKDEIEVKF